MSTIHDFIGLLFDGIKSNRLLWALIVGFALFPIYTHLADLPFWNDVAMRIMLLGMAAMAASLSTLRQQGGRAREFTDAERERSMGGATIHRSE